MLNFAGGFFAGAVAVSVVWFIFTSVLNKVHTKLDAVLVALGTVADALKK
jgi:hypothetical protein